MLPYAPDLSYGRPEHFKAFVEAAHRRGVSVLLDVVYNHFGPEGNILPRYAPDILTDRHKTPWGDAINFDGPNSRPVREFFIQNAEYWIKRFISTDCGSTRRIRSRTTAGPTCSTNWRSGSESASRDRSIW